MHQKDGKPPFSVPALQTSCCREGVGGGAGAKRPVTLLKLQRHKHICTDGKITVMVPGWYDK